MAKEVGVATKLWELSRTPEVDQVPGVSLGKEKGPE